MRALRTRAPWISVLRAGIPLLIVGGLVALQFHWVGELDRARQRETRRVLQAACERIAQLVDERVSALAEGLARSGDPSDLEPQLAAMVAAVETLDEAHFDPTGGRILPGPALRFGASGRTPDGPPRAALLDRAHLAGTLLPELARRSLGQEALETYQLAVVSVDRSEEPLYVSSVAFDLDQADASAAVLHSPNQWFGFFQDEGAAEPEADWASLTLPLAGEPQASRWTLMLRHRAGSVAAALARGKRWNLTLGVTLIALLVLVLALVWLAEKRARALMERELAFVAGVSHELRTPLAVVRTAASNLASGAVAGADKAREYGLLIEREVERVGQMVERVLRLTRGDGALPASRDPVDVRQLVADAVDGCAPWHARRRFELVSEVAPGLPALRGDADALGSAVRNLLENAIKYGPDGQTVRIAAHLNGHGSARDELVIDVRDQGPGIPVRDRDQALEPFWRGEAAVRAAIPGSGLGLAVAARVAQEHGGRVRIESADDGACISLELPLAGRGGPDDLGRSET